MSGSNPQFNPRSLQQSYQELKDAHANATEQLDSLIAEGDLAGLQKLNSSLHEIRQQFEEELKRSITTLPDGREIYTHELLALQSFSTDNGHKADWGYDTVGVKSGRVVVLNANCYEISRLEALKGLTALERLYLANNRLTDLTPLSGLSALTRINLNNNQLTDLSPLSGLTGLMRVNLNSNQLNDLTPLAGLTNLTELHLCHNQITDLTPLAGVTALITLDVSNNRITDLTPLTGLMNLRGLYIRFTPIKGTDPQLSQFKPRGCCVEI